MDDGSQKPIAYASRTRSKREREYLQLDKEALEVIFAATKFHQFLYGRHFIIYIDHKPLLGLLNSDKSTDMHGRKNSNAAPLSRLPLPEMLHSRHYCRVPSSTLWRILMLAHAVDAVKMK